MDPVPTSRGNTVQLRLTCSALGTYFGSRTLDHGSLEGVENAFHPPTEHALDRSQCSWRQALTAAFKALPSTRMIDSFRKKSSGLGSPEMPRSGRYQKSRPLTRASSRLQGRAAPQRIQDSRHIANGSRPFANAKNASLFCCKAFFDSASTV